MNAGIYVPLGLFAMVTISVALITRIIGTGMLNKTIREALKSDPGSVDLLAQRLEARQPWADALLGWIFLALAVALVGLSLFENAGARKELLQAAMIQVVIGATVLFYVRRERRRAPEIEAASPAVRPEPIARNYPTVQPAPASGQAGSRGGITRRIESLLMDSSLSYLDIREKVLREFPKAKTSTRAIASAASRMRRTGTAVPMRRPSNS